MPTMAPVVRQLVEHPLLLLFILLAVGTAVGRLSVRGLSLGPAAVLFAALGFSAWDERMAVPEIVGTFGLAVFAYTVGITAGPSFFASLRSSTGAVTMVVGTLVGLGGLTYLLGHFLGLDRGTVAGLFAGANTNTPALAAATVELGGSPEPTIGYSLAYVGGVIVMLLAAAYALRLGELHPTADDHAVPPALSNATIQIDRDGLPPASELTDTPDGPVIFSRYQTDGVVGLAVAGTVLRPGDRVLVIGTEKSIAHVVRRLGHISPIALNMERNEFDFRRIVLSRGELYGRTIADLHLWHRFGARATRVRRADQDLLATDDFVLQAGDRIRVAAPSDQMGEVARFLGDSEHGTSDINPLGLAIGMAIGLAIGIIAIPIPGLGDLTLGQAAGPIIAGLCLGYLGRTGPVVWTLPHQASETLTQLGVLLFLAYAGGRAGSQVVDALSTPLGLKLVVAGLVVTLAHAVAVVLIARKALHVSGPRTAGILAGSQTQPALLAYANEATTFDRRVALGYAMVYPVAMVAKIMIAQVLAML